MSTQITPPSTTMKWKCCDCKRTFDGPNNRAPSEGCYWCSSRNVLDVNVEPYLKPIRLAIRKMTAPATTP